MIFTKKKFFLKFLLLYKFDDQILFFKLKKNKNNKKIDRCSNFKYVAQFFFILLGERDQETTGQTFEIPFSLDIVLVRQRVSY